MAPSYTNFPELSFTETSCTMDPLIWNTTARLPSLSGQTRDNRISVLSIPPEANGTLKTTAGPPGTIPWRYTGVGRCRINSPPLVTCLVMKSENTFGYIREDIAFSEEIGIFHFADKVAMCAAKSSGGRVRPARTVLFVPDAPFSTALVTDSGKPRCGNPDKH